MTLAAYQAAFLAALWETAVSDSPLELATQPGFAVYRNTVMKGCIDALAANYPAVAALVGAEWFRAAAAVFVRDNPPPRASLLDYGAGFADFLAEFPPAAGVRWLVPVARLDRQWTEAHVARDAPHASAALLSSAKAETIARLRLRPHPAARWSWDDEVPIHSLWALNRGLLPMPVDGLASVRWVGEGVLMTRPGDAVMAQALPRAAFALLDACAAGAGFVAAVDAAIACDADCDLRIIVATLLRSGAFLPP